MSIHLTLAQEHNNVNTSFTQACVTPCRFAKKCNNWFFVNHQRDIITMTEAHVLFAGPAPEAAPADVDPRTAYLAAVTMSDAEWDAHQESRYPGTQEMIDTRRGLLAEVKEFAAPETPLAALFEHLDPAVAEIQDPIQRLGAYEGLCEEHFDFRKGRERQEVGAKLKQTREEVGAELWDRTFEAAAAEGMVDNTELPDGDEVKAMGILGGTKNAIENRAKYGLEQIDQHGATVESFDFLVAEGNETAWALNAAKEQLGAKTDEEDIVGVEKTEKGIVTTLQPVEIAGRMVPVRIMTAAAREGRNRATTLETMALWGEVSGATPDDRMVAVTTGMYVGFQRANAKEVLTWANGSQVDVIGHSAEWAGMDRFSNQLAQELKATVDSRYRLYQKMIDTGLVAAE
jgi:hypothetical protein